MCFVNPWAFVQEVFRQPKQVHHEGVSLDVKPLIATKDKRIIVRDDEEGLVTVEESISSQIIRSATLARLWLERGGKAVYRLELSLADSVRLPMEWLTSNTLGPELTLKLRYIRKQLRDELERKELKMDITTYGGNVLADQPIILDVLLTDNTPDD